MDDLRLPPFSTKELVNYQLLSSCSSFKEASERCALSQPALSIQIKHLEEKVGVQLIDRQGSSRGIALTAEGVEFLRMSQHVLKEIRETLRKIRPAQCARGTLRIACLPSLIRQLASSLVVEVGQAELQDKLIIFDGDSAVCSTQLMSRESDIAICSRPVNGVGIEAAFLFSEMFCVLVSRSNVLAGRDVLSARELEGSLLVRLSGNNRVNDLFRREMSRSIEVSSIKALESVLLQGSGVAVVAASAAASVHHDDLIKIPLSDVDLNRDIFISWRSDAGTQVSQAVARIRQKFRGSRP